MIASRLLLGSSMMLLAAGLWACDEDDDDEDPTADAGAPYIYLYPETAGQIDVELLPAPGCEISSSDPAYGDGWSVWVEPSGRIDGAYDFLFYTARVHWDFQLDHGWVVPGEDIFHWFEEALPGMGFTVEETGDFIAYWSGHLPYAPYYRIHPQDNVYVDRQIGLSVDPHPDSVLRLWFVIIGDEECAVLDEPLPSDFERVGFVVVEWGVVLEGESFVW